MTFPGPAWGICAGLREQDTVQELPREKPVDTCSFKTSKVTFITITEEYMLAVKISETTEKQKENKSPYSHYFLICLHVMISRTLFGFFPFRMKLYYKR